MQDVRRLLHEIFDKAAQQARLGEVQVSGGGQPLHHTEHQTACLPAVSQGARPRLRGNSLNDLQQGQGLPDSQRAGCCSA